MSDFDTYVNRIKSKGNFRDERILIEKMISEVTAFVNDIAAADLMVSQVYTLEKELKYSKNLSDEEREKLEDKIKKAKDAKRLIDDQKEAVRALRGPISQLNSIVNKIR